MSISTTVTGVAAATLLALAAAGCAGSGSDSPSADSEAKAIPTVDAFSPGPCRALAPGLIDTLRAANRHAGSTDARAVAADLTPIQARLHALAPSAGAHRADVDGVTTAIGFVRLRADVHSYDPALLTDVRTATQALVTRCSTPG